ncbi:hypothetical protein HYPGJ_20143 [Hyphomicrobium sp. GJ21]|jgi:cation transport ATPase|nr:hypothetical protein HYPGJ_20143 [Hyphomicrobium sp. GJ21]
MSLRPETAFRKGEDGTTVEVPAAELAVGDVVNAKRQTEAWLANELA